MDEEKTMSEKPMKRMIKQLFGWGAAGITAILITSAFVLIYNYSGTHIANPSGATDYKWASNQYKGNMTEGINFMRMDENGFNNLSADTKNIDILLMGGSHMEAVQFPTEKNTGSLMNEMMPEYKTYNIGVSGHQFLNCLDNLEAAIDEYKPEKYVVLQSGNVSVTEEGLESVLDGSLADIPSYDSGALYYLQKIPVIKVVYKQLIEKINVDRERTVAVKANAVDPAESSEDPDRKTELLSQILEEKSEYCINNGLQLVMAYNPAVEVDENGDMQRSDDEEWVGIVREECKENGICFIDCYEVFETCYKNTFEVPYGFNNTVMGSGHLNETGHRLLAEAIKETLEGEQ